MTYSDSKSHKTKPQRARKRGTLIADQDRLRIRYDTAVIGKRRGPKWQDPTTLFDATGDPLVLQNPVLAAELYGLSTALRPNVTLRHVRAKTFGDSFSSLVDMAIWFQEHRRWSALRSAGEAAVLAAERGTWIGNKVPVSFDRAVELIRKGVGRARSLGHLRYQPHAWSGDCLFVVPVPGRLIRIPAPAPPRSSLPEDGAWVKDDSFWRRCIRSGDVLLKSRSAEKHPTIDEKLRVT